MVPLELRLMELRLMGLRLMELRLMGLQLLVWRLVAKWWAGSKGSDSWGARRSM